MPVFVGVALRMRSDDMMVAGQLVLAGSVREGGGEVVRKLLPVRQARPAQGRRQSSPSDIHPCLTITRNILLRQHSTAIM